jgi:zinc protease
MPSGAAAPPSNVPPPPPNPTRIDHQAGSSQARVILGGPLPGLVSEDRFPLSVANAVLGGSGFRLFREIRDKRGLSYDPGPGMAQFPDAGLWMVSAGTAPENVALMIELFTAELERIRTEPVSADELTNARNYLEGSLVVGLETPIAQAGQMIRDEKFGSPVLSDEHKAGIRRVTADDVLRVCRDYLDPARATTVVVAP